MKTHETGLVVGGKGGVGVSTWKLAAIVMVAIAVSIFGGLTWDLNLRESIQQTVIEVDLGFDTSGDKAEG